MPVKIHRDVGGIRPIKPILAEDGTIEVLRAGCGLFYVVATRNRRKITCERKGCRTRYRR